MLSLMFQAALRAEAISAFDIFISIASRFRFAIDAADDYWPYARADFRHFATDTLSSMIFSRDYFS
jgi:hypothetical protein